MSDNKVGPREADARQIISALIRGYEIMERALFNIAGTSGGSTAWYTKTACEATYRIDPLWKLSADSNPSKPGDCFRGRADILSALATPEPVDAGTAGAWRDLCEKDDRTSPGEYPGMALITRDELAGYMRRAETALPPDVVELVIAARALVFDQPQESVDRLDKAVEAFSARVPYEDET